MPQEIQIGQDVLEFPDNMPDDQIRMAIDREYGGRNSQSQPQQQESSLFDKATEFAKGLPQGLGNKAIGAVQAGASALGYGDSDFAKRLANNVGELKERQSQLPTAERTGIVGGEIAADLALTRGRSLATGGAFSGLTTPLEDSSTQARLAETGKDAAISQAFGTGVNLVGKAAGAAKEGVKNIVKGFKAEAPEGLDNIAKSLKDQAKVSYDAAAELGGSLKPQATKKIISEINTAVKADGPLFKTNHGNTLSILKEIQDDAISKKFKLGIDDIDQYRKALSDTIQGNTDRLTGIVSPDGRKATIAASKLEAILDNLPDNYLVNAADKQAASLFKQGNKDYGVYRRFQRMADIAQKSQGDPNLIKRNLTNFVKNKKNLQGFNPEIKTVIRKAANMSGGEGMLKMFGKFGIDLGSPLTQGNTVAPVIGASLGTAAAGIKTGGATLAAGTVARQAQKYIARGKLDDALKLIQSSGNPSKTISQIPNSKIREKLIQHLIKGGAITIAETN